MADRLIATTPMNQRLTNIPPSGARMPNAAPARISTMPWTSSVTTSRSTRPARMASRLTGVTRSRSITP
jgi:hypothetical protein